MTARPHLVEVESEFVRLTLSESDDPLHNEIDRLAKRIRHEHGPYRKEYLQGAADALMWAKWPEEFEAPSS